MPSKFKPSERIYPLNARGQRMSTVSPVKLFKHYYYKQTPKVELFTAINEKRTTPKKRIKCINELVRRGVTIEFMTQDQFDGKELV